MAAWPPALSSHRRPGSPPWRSGGASGVPRPAEGPGPSRRRHRLGVAAIWAGAHFLTRSGWAQDGCGPAQLPLGRDALLAWPRRDADRWRRGAAGEQATAALLAGLAPRRWTVLHDLAVPGAGPTSTIWSSVPPPPVGVDSKGVPGNVQARWGRVRVGGVPLSTAAVRWEQRWSRTGGGGRGGEGGGGGGQKCIQDAAASINQPYNTNGRAPTPCTTSYLSLNTHQSPRHTSALVLGHTYSLTPIHAR